MGKTRPPRAWAKHRGIPVPLFVYLMYQYLGPFPRDRCLYLTETLLSRVPRALFVRMVVEGDDHTGQLSAEQKAERTRRGQALYDFTWVRAYHSELEAALLELLSKTQGAPASALPNAEGVEGVEDTAGTEAHPTTQSDDPHHLDSGTIPCFTLPNEWFANMDRQVDFAMQGPQEGEAGEEDEAERGGAGGDFNPHVCPHPPVLQWDGNESEGEGEGEDEDDDGNPVDDGHVPGLGRFKEMVDPENDISYAPVFDDDYQQLPDVQLYATGAARYMKRPHLRHLTFSPVTAFSAVCRAMRTYGHEYELERMNRFIARNGGLQYCQLMAVDVSPLRSAFADECFTQSHLIMLLQATLRDSYGELEHLHDMHPDHVLFVPQPQAPAEAAAAPQVLMLATRVFFALLQAMCLTAEGRETRHFGRMPIILRLIKRGFRLPPVMHGLPAKHGFLDSHLRAPLYEHLYYWVRSEYFRWWTWDMVAYPVHSAKYQLYKLIFPILMRWSIVPPPGQDPTRQTLLQMLQLAFSQGPMAGENLMASIEAFFMQNIAERYHCISRDALSILYDIMNFERSARAHDLRTQFPALAEYVRRLWITFQNMPGSPHIKWVPLGFYPFVYSRSWCKQTYRMYRTACRDAGMATKDRLGYFAWLRRQQSIYTPSHKIVSAIYTACANPTMLTGAEARTVFLGIRARAHREPVYLCQRVRQTDKRQFHINIVPPQVREEGAAHWHGVERAYPLDVNKPTIHRLSDHFVKVKELYDRRVDMVSVPEYEPIPFSQAHLIGEMVAVYELGRILEYVYRVPHTKSRSSWLVHDLALSPIFITDEEHLLMPCLYPAACVPLAEGADATPQTEDKRRVLYDEYHLGLHTPHDPVEEWEYVFAPWLTALHDFPSYVHEVALLYSEESYRLAACPAVQPIDGTHLTEPHFANPQLLHSIGGFATRHVRRQRQQRQRQRATGGTAATTGGPRVHPARQTPQDTGLPVPKQAQAPPRYTVIEEGDLLHGLKQAPTDLDAVERKHLKAKAEAAARQRQAQEPRASPTRNRKRKRAQSNSRRRSQGRAPKRRKAGAKTSTSKRVREPK